MNHFQQLREIAAKKKDSAIQAAKLEYNETIQRIAELETRLKGERRPPRKNSHCGHTKLADLIYSVLPDDRVFSLDDVIGLVNAADPARKFSRQTIYTNLNRLLHSGDIKRVRFAGHKSTALFAMPGVEVPVKSMADWAIEVLKDAGKPMKAVEILVSMTEKGFGMTTASPANSVASLERELKKSPAISFNDGFWSA